MGKTIYELVQDFFHGQYLYYNPFVSFVISFPETAIKPEFLTALLEAQNGGKACGTRYPQPPLSLEDT